MAGIERLAQMQELLRRDPHLIEHLTQMQALHRRDPHLIEHLTQMQALHRRDPHLIERLAEAAHSIEKQFRLPQVAETAALLHEFERSGAGTASRRELETQRALLHELERSGAGTASRRELAIQRAMAAMRSPWLDTENRIQSVTGFVRLQDLGYALRTMPAFDTALADRLRPALGDWRKPIDWPEDIFSDPLARADFYAARGFDPTLTAFPAAAFNESITIAGLKKPLLNMRETNDSEREAEVDEEEAGFARTNAAHHHLQHFESKMRKFIDRQMKAVFGGDWIKHQVPGQIRQGTVLI